MDSSPAEKRETRHKGMVDIVVKIPRIRCHKVQDDEHTRRIASRHLYQAAAYMMLAEEAFKTLTKKSYICCEKSDKPGNPMTKT
ncbi:MAG: hypothetical protein QXS21_07045 [Thermoproteota archaeon]|nr:hypothetical protein [Candidatus Brockarchaeota archaeon]